MWKCNKIQQLLWVVVSIKAYLGHSQLLSIKLPCLKEEDFCSVLFTRENNEEYYKDNKVKLDISLAYISHTAENKNIYIKAQFILGIKFPLFFQCRLKMIDLPRSLHQVY